MRIIQVRVALGATVNTGNYSSQKAEVEFVAEVERPDEWPAAAELLETICKDRLGKLVNQINEQRLLIDED